MPITIFDSDTIPRDRRPELEAAVAAAGRHLTKLFEGWIVARPDRRKFAVRITSYPDVDIIVPFDWNATAADVTEQVRAAMPRLTRRAGVSPKRLRKDAGHIGKDARRAAGAGIHEQPCVDSPKAIDTA